MSTTRKVIASFEENPITRLGHNGGDGTSASSVGTSSPDIFQGNNQKYMDPNHFQSYSTSDQPPNIVESYKFQSSSQPNDNEFLHLDGRSDFNGYQNIYEEYRDDSNLSQFQRGTARKSLKSDHLDKWIDMQESYVEFKRHEPAGAPPSPVDKFSIPITTSTIQRQSSTISFEGQDSEFLNVILKPTMGENLGVSVEGWKTADACELGLSVFHIDPKGCAARDGRIQVGDRIVAINNQDLTNITNERAEETFHKALQCDAIELQISRSQISLRDNFTDRVNGIHDEKNIDKAMDDDVPMNEKSLPLRPSPASSTVFKKSLVAQDKVDVSIPRVTEKIFAIELQKGSDGLGFSVTTRDNPAIGARPIFVKNILSHGSAVRDGQLQAGDQILQVDGIEMSGRSQQEAVNILRRTKGKVKLLIKRQVVDASSVGSNSKLMINDLERAPSDSRGNKILTYQIALPSSDSAGLGITVKGKSNVSEQNDNSEDLGIFVKTVVHGGAAYKDGRLRPDDQLISINGVKLTGMSNSSAMKTLRSAMLEKMWGNVEVTIIRSAKEIMESFNDLHKIGEQNTSKDRAIDIGAANDKFGISRGTANSIEEFGKKEKLNEDERKPGVERSFESQETEKIKEDSLPNNLRPQTWKIDKLNISADSKTAYFQQRTLSDDKTKPSRKTMEQSYDSRKYLENPVVNKEIGEVKTSNYREMNENTITISKEKDKIENGISELKPNRVKATTKLGNGIHRNRSYYIAMNRTGQRAERSPRARKPKSPFYQPSDEKLLDIRVNTQSTQSRDSYSRNVQSRDEQSRAVNDEKPKIVIASITDTTKVWSAGSRPTALSNRPTSTFAEPTSALSTSATIPRPSTQSRAGLSPTSERYRPPTSINIPKGTPPPPPPRTQRPSPYTKQLSNYLLKTSQTRRRSDSSFSDYSDVSDISSTISTPNDNSAVEAKLPPTTNYTSKITNDEKPKASPQHSNELKNVDNIDYLTDVDDDEEGSGDCFVRDGLGRQSMSEKRFKLAQADITQTDFYKNRVTRSKSLEGTLKDPNVESQTLPRSTATPIEKSYKYQRRKSSDEYSERSIKSTPASSSDRRNVKISGLDQYVRGQWRASSDGVVKKYGRHGNYMKSSPLSTMSNASESGGGAVSTNSFDEDGIPITMQSNADYNSVNAKLKKKSSGFTLKNLGAALKPKAFKGKYDMQSRQSPDSPCEPAVDMDEQRYRQLVLGEARDRSFSQTNHTKYKIAESPDVGRSRKKRQEQQKRSSPTSLQDILKKGSGEYSITEAAQI
ncbi:uncharacterized protein LOC124440768 isoform X3 [Xenia sp. Carnegie-2017]|uniref:uncharacterized protein LOC124440768 isoform X3 n=1 Tax=Xenia sp. Carnegie-2017 TaxID=2897299 RepID=UPI001F03F7CF|nr:uncharacterized protein LOC124440768 isoform X3 [Xenia sp. Carnegie-2017]